MSLSQNQIDSADQTDLAEFLLSRGIRLRKVSNQYVWDERNVWISGSKWYSHYDQIGGHAIDFVMKYFGTYVNARHTNLHCDIQFPCVYYIVGFGMESVRRRCVAAHYHRISDSYLRLHPFIKESAIWWVNSKTGDIL